MIGSAMEALVRWTIIGLELAALAAIAGGFVWSVANSIIVYTRDTIEERYASFRRGLGRGTLISLELLVAPTSYARSCLSHRCRTSPFSAPSSRFALFSASPSMWNSMAVGLGSG
jgi:hypothetical protein